MITELTDDTVFDAISQDGLVVLDVFATWCSPCVQLLKILPRLESTLTTVAKLYKLDIDKSPQFAAAQGIRSIPTFIFYRDGKEVHRFSGVQTLGEIETLARAL